MPHDKAFRTRHLFNTQYQSLVSTFGQFSTLVYDVSVLQLLGFLFFLPWLNQVKDESRYLQVPQLLRDEPPVNLFPFFIFYFASTI